MSNEIVKDNPLKLDRDAFVAMMRNRTRLQVAHIRPGSADRDDQQWGARQMVLQVFREYGFTIILHAGDIGYYDSEPDSPFATAFTKVINAG